MRIHLDIPLEPFYLKKTPKKERWRAKKMLEHLENWEIYEPEVRTEAAAAVHAILTRRADSLMRTWSTRKEADKGIREMKRVIRRVGINCISMGILNDGHTVVIKRI